MENYEIKKATVADWPELINIFDKSLRTTDEFSDEDWAKNKP